MKKLWSTIGIISLIILSIFSTAMRCAAAPPHSEKKFKASDEKAVVLIHKALEAMGGESKLRALKSLQFEGIGHTYAVEQSERPEGPWITTYQQTSELRDVVNQRTRFTTESKMTLIPQWAGVTLIVADGVAMRTRDGKYALGDALQVATTKQDLALAPERILFKALEAPDLRLEKDVQMQSVSQKPVKFTWNKIPVTIYLNSATNLPTAVEILSSLSYDTYWSVWGDCITRTYYTYWTLEQGGIHYPHQFDTERNGTPLSSFTIINMQVNVSIDEKLFLIPDDVRQKFAALPKPVKGNDIPLGNHPSRSVQEILPGVVKIPAGWDIAFVKQSDGVVIIEAPRSSGYSVKAIEKPNVAFRVQK